MPGKTQRSAEVKDFTSCTPAWRSDGWLAPKDGDQPSFKGERRRAVLCRLSRTRHERWVSELAPDVAMLNPATDDPVVGKEAVASALAAVEAACDDFRHTHLLSDSSSSHKPLFGLVFVARVGDPTLRGRRPHRARRPRPHHQLHGSGSTARRSHGTRSSHVECRISKSVTCP